MATTNKITFGTDLNIPDDIETVAEVTGIGIIDLGYVCSDSHPFFKFGSYYTKVNPIYAVEPTRVDLYSYNSSTYRMTKLGIKGIQTGTSLTYGSATYTYESYTDVRVDRINKWAREKSLPINQDDDLTEAQKIGINRGLTVDSKTTIGAVVDALKTAKDGNGENLWTYTPPPVASSYRKRLRDFDGYNHKANNPWQYELDYAQAWKGDVATVRKRAVLLNADDMTFDDLGVLSGKYVAVAFRKQMAITPTILAKTMTASDNAIEIPISKLSVGTWDVAVFASSVLLDFDSTSTPNGTFVPLPSLFQTLTVNEGTGITFEGTNTSASGSVLSFTLAIKRQRQASLGYCNIIYRPNSGVQSTTAALGAVTVPTTRLVSLNIGSLAPTWYSSGRVWCQYSIAGEEVNEDITDSIMRTAGGIS